VKARVSECLVLRPAPLTALLFAAVLGSPGCSSRTAPERPSPRWEWQTRFDAGKEAYSRGDLTAAEEEFKRAREAARYEDPPGLATALSLNALSTLLINAGRPNEAGPLLDEATRIFEARGATENEHFAMLLTNRGQLALDLGRPDEAEREYRRSLAIVAVPQAVHDRALRGLVVSLCLQGRAVEARHAGAELSIECRGEEQVGSVAHAPVTRRGTEIGAQPSTETALEPGIAMIFDDAAVVEWSNKEASVLLTLRGQNIRRGHFNPPRAGTLLLIIGGKAFEILDLDSKLVTVEYATHAELLSKHRQWEIDDWKRELGVPLESHTETIADCECPEASLWRVSWPEELRTARGNKATDQLFLTFVAGKRIVVVTSAVMEGESVADRVRYLGRVACEARLLPGPINQKEFRQWLKENGWEISPAESDRG
jgi:hypothetical protein